MSVRCSVHRIAWTCVFCLGVVTSAVPTAAANSWATTYQGNPYAFYVNSGSLCIRYRANSSWFWAKWPAPGLIGTPSADSYQNRAEKPRLEVFARTSSGALKGRLYDAGWKPWFSWGTPSETTTVASDPASIPPDTLHSDVDDVRVFVTGSDGHVWMASRPSDADYDEVPDWTDLGKPDGNSVNRAPTATTSNGITWWVFAVANVANVNHLFGYQSTSGFWIDMGAPPGPAGLGTTNIPSATYDRDTNKVYVFVRATDGHLFRVSLMNGSYDWEDESSDGTLIATSPAAVTTVSAPYMDSVLAFGVANGGWVNALRSRYETSGGWAWANLLFPGDDWLSLAQPGVAATFDDAFNRYIWVFARGTGSSLAIREWNGSAWSWLDSQTCP